MDIGDERRHAAQAVTNPAQHSMKALLQLTLSVVLLGGLTACQNTDLSRMLSGAQAASTGELSLDTVVAGLKEALTVGTKQAVATTSKQGGFAQNPALRLVTPPELQSVASRLRSVGLGGLVDQFEGQMNLAAEQASARATPVFVDAVKQMTFADAKGILDGGPTAATDYFRRTTEARLKGEFDPIVEKRLGELGVVRTYNDLMDRYTAIPFTRKPEFNLTDYVTSKSLDGLFATLAQEEAKIRQDPAARTTALLQRVFGRP